MTALSHIDEQGLPSMVDVSSKKVTTRTALAEATVVFPAAVFEQLAGQHFLTKKGAVFQTAIIAGVMAAKKTSDIIPLCHPLALSTCQIDIAPTQESSLKVTCLVRCEGKTGVEMEALTGASAAALCIYDMCKALTHDITIQEVKLLQKTGGKSDVHAGR
ncbi:cyclic pyranopterin monophosphate synthase MoaC [Rufibacter glacialis]|uniref:Cyclic pyranopterin monophosphate synthase n=1 Tax=Rufibacter glacialis TaxID=1259555 RepID=A0A5M8QE53_9BACT|nr:cyclic pyranopterin monophosphate synthase MoaC [Rufibacter glacialis]KAA6434325.1 cyclic pyranopterin monophosphate synthase MoaC [Rufibacter glacialis]GGK68597.1 cyclic pyranopterin monophosphate synthase accessory protein [Rufibacter glacialis]